MQWRSARRHARSHITTSPRTPRACSRSGGAMGALWAKRRRTLCMRAQWCIAEVVRKVVERNGARADRRGAAAARRAQSQQQHASPPPQHARSSKFHLSVLLFKCSGVAVSRRAPPFSAASPRGRKSHTFHRGKGPFGRGAAENVKEPPTATRKCPKT